MDEKENLVTPTLASSVDRLVYLAYLDWMVLKGDLVSPVLLAFLVCLAVMDRRDSVVNVAWMDYLVSREKTEKRGI